MIYWFSCICWFFGRVWQEFEILISWLHAELEYSYFNISLQSLPMMVSVIDRSMHIMFLNEVSLPWKRGCFRIYLSIVGGGSECFGGHWEGNPIYGIENELELNCSHMIVIIAPNSQSRWSVELLPSYTCEYDWSIPINYSSHYYIWPEATESRP